MRKNGDDIIEKRTNPNPNSTKLMIDSPISIMLITGIM